ncbi:MAG: DUF3048 domain-containing protein [Anaerolineaceae bacterium]|nr:DUF3048 domain-containing protein [Anaerolineaceae bacterium]
MKRNKRYSLWLVLALLTTILTACGQTGLSEVEMAGTYAAQTIAAMPSATEKLMPTVTATPEPTATATATPEPTLGPVGPVDFPEGVNPLTGLMVDNPENLNRRPVFVKVANYPANGRPHAGLSSADIVFEYYIGYGSNRFMAVFYGENADQIGPVRSGRLVDPQLVNMYQGILGFQGAYETILTKIVDSLGVRAISGTGNVCPAICDNGESNVTSIFANSAELTSLASQRGVDNHQYTLEGMAFDPVAPAGGSEGTDVLVQYSNLDRGEWVFDIPTGKYLRLIEDTTGSELEMVPLTDRNTGEQLAFSNVVVLYAYYTEYAASMHDIDIWGNTTGRPAVIFRDGQAYEVTWKAASNNQPIQFFDENGDPFPLKPGNTWMAIMGIYSSATQAEGDWKFIFNLP